VWKLVFGSVQGTSHGQSGLPCQDYCVGKTDGATLIAACADGAGSAELSQLGAQAAVDRFLEVAIADTQPTVSQIAGWVEAARERLIEVAKANQSTPRQLACTFLAALVGDGWASFAQVGDGIIVFDGQEGYTLAFWPDSGEYINTTRFLSDDDYQDHLRVEVIDQQVGDLAVMTDGLQMLALDLAGAKVHERFFAPLFSALRNGPEEAMMQASLLAFLGSPRVNERTDDDKTLLLATRIAPHAPPSLSNATA
jgi:hypothetical protein